MDIVTKKDEIELYYKNIIYKKLAELRSIEQDFISSMIEYLKTLGQINVNILNVSTTLNNKLSELSQEFQKAGISIFSKEYEEYGFVGTSFVGNAIIHDLLDKYNYLIKILKEYSEAIEFDSKQRRERLIDIQNVSQLKKFFSQIIPLLSSVQHNTLAILIDKMIQEYNDVNSEIRDYNLEENIVHALVKEIARPDQYGEFNIKHKYSASVVPGLLEESVIPDLKKLGLEHLIPLLKKALIEEYKKDLPDPEIYQVSSEYMHLYVPDFSRAKEEKHDFTDEELEELYNSVYELLNTHKQHLSNGATTPNKR